MGKHQKLSKSSINRIEFHEILTFLLWECSVWAFGWGEEKQDNISTFKMIICHFNCNVFWGEILKNNDFWLSHSIQDPVFSNNGFMWLFKQKIKCSKNECVNGSDGLFSFLDQSDVTCCWLLPCCSHSQGQITEPLHKMCWSPY